MSRTSAENRRRWSFPSGVGWIPATIAIAIASLFAIFAVAPQFTAPQVVSRPGQDTTSGGGGNVPGGSGATGGTTGSSGSAGQTITGPGHSGGGGGGTTTAQVRCAPGQNGGATDVGVTANSINVASTIVTTGLGGGFLGQAGDGIQAAINQTNNAGGVCGRYFTRFDNNQHGVYLLNDNWDPNQGCSDINNWIGGSQPKVFALVGEPDSEGLGACIDNGNINNAPDPVTGGKGIPVVGTDGMLADQYWSPWVFPVAASTVTNMHVLAKYLVAQGAKSFGIVYDTGYRFGKEGALAFDNELARLTGNPHPIQGDQNVNQCSGSTAFCGIDDSGQYGNGPVTAFDSACAPCDAVVLLLEPQLAIDWMSAESGNWEKSLYGGEPLFDRTVVNGCGGCNQDKMIVWTGYQPAVDGYTNGGSAPNDYCNALHSINGNDDCSNEFTEGAYIGTLTFIHAVQKLGDLGLPLTRANLQHVLDTNGWSLPLTGVGTLTFSSNLPDTANTAMAAFQDNSSGSTFLGWQYLNTGFIGDPNPHEDLPRP
ncbi:MAG: ABC transporter substrate-binding protein [Candidatus Dormibacteria bacterium]